MKKNYLKPAVQAQIFTVKSVMLEESSAIGGNIDDDEEVLVKDIEDISSDLFGNESFGGAEEW